jgi:APA family basic amino acid/polyamine antiporter
VTESSHGLIRTIGRWSLVALMINMIIGGSILRLPSILASSLGGRSPLSCLAAGAGMLVVAGCIAEVSSRYDETGGLYLYARDAFGRFAGLLVAWLIWLTRIAAPAAGADLFCTFAAQFFPALGTRRGELIGLAVLIGHLAILNYIGVKSGKNLSNAFTFAKVGILAFFVVAGIVALVLRPEIRIPLSIPATPLKNWLEPMLILVYAYGGFEGALLVGGESKNPKRDTPIALLIALGVVCVTYAAIQWVTIATLPNVASSVRPLSDAAQRFLGPGGAAVMGIAGLISMYGYLSANLLSVPRITFALGEQGDFPAFFAAVHSRYRTPHVSILLYAGILFTFAALGTFQWNAILSAASRLAVYGAMAIAVPVLRRRGDNKAQFLMPFPYAFSAAGLLFSVALLLRMGRNEFLVIAATCAIALVNWIVLRRFGDGRHDTNKDGRSIYARG